MISLESNKYKEIFKLKKMLEDEGIPFEFIDRSFKDDDIMKLYPDLWESYQLCYPSNDRKERWISVVEGFGTHGAEQDRLEIMGGFTPMEIYYDKIGPTLGWLTAKNVFKRIKNHYEKEKKLYGK